MVNVCAVTYHGYSNQFVNFSCSSTLEELKSQVKQVIGSQLFVFIAREICFNTDL